MSLNIVLVEPEIHWNTGNIGRTCVAAGARLHLVGRLGFRISSKEIKRSGLDYWPKLDLTLHKDFEAFEASLASASHVLGFSAKAGPSYWDAPYEDPCYLVFGRESNGFSPEIEARLQGRLYRIPMQPGLRSLNLSTSAGVVLYEALRSTRKGSLVS